MKVQILSDLHLEFGYSSSLKFVQADLIILAGDTHIGTKGIEWIKKYIPTKEVIYLLGNHEYYKGSYPKTLYKIQDAAKGSNIHVLEDSFVDIGNIRFHGSTLWTDFSIFGNPIEYGMLCQEKMNDYKRIKRDPSYSKLRSIDVYQIHQKSMRWLEQSLRESIVEKNIVITHHAPSLLSVPEQYQNDPVTAAYTSNLESFIMTHQPQYWIHGHIHSPIQYNIGQTKVICNPHGYIDDRDNGFNKELIIEI
ncbi:metallophosphoesterase [Myroides marinus]|uniref:Predicted phosphoesterase n=1 Tax=Myroides marinus TaxID=703342 RepID=A0A1H6SL56_9FLAO|nr:metallophosphoesterase [Myroides marinus]MDM1346173.1 metallophosphoesterase [Myroides marinus]MDM1351160.1 metallophosphoesterase [Myroides marinus]MDM1353427.1 metallophosphoesterase [Myroides marinus]MDM1358324.1 metallophosphoesterase [Myroides marinus]MDM1362733.1 metallophosphoesterase [Myroides marinus]